MYDYGDDQHAELVLIVIMVMTVVTVSTELNFNLYIYVHIHIYIYLFIYRSNHDDDCFHNMSWLVVGVGLKPAPKC